MNFAFKIIAFSLMINFAVGIMMQAVPIFNTDDSTSGGMLYNETQMAPFSETIGAGVNPTTVMQRTDNLFYRVLDMLNLGFIASFIEAIGFYMYAGVTLFGLIFRGLLDDGLWNLFFAENTGIATIAMTVMYGYALLLLWTGRNNIVGD